MKKATILDVAAAAGVSKSVVSRVMQGSPRVSEAKQRAVLAAADRLNYRPNAAARTIVSRRSNSIGVVVSDFRNPFVAEVLDGVRGAADEAGVSVIIMGGEPSARAERDALRVLLEMRADGLVLVCPTLETRDIVGAAREVPTAIVARSTNSPDVTSVTNDDRLGAETVVDHLVELGHVDVAHIDGGIVAGARPRRGGYQRAMQKRGLGSHINIVHATCTEQGGRAGMIELLRGDRHPTAVFAANDFAALGALEAIDRAGLRVPQDISVVGYDNTWLADIHQLNLTTVDQPKHEMGQIATATVLERIEMMSTPVQHVVLPPTLVVRGTTAAPHSPN